MALHLQPPPPKGAPLDAFKKPHITHAECRAFLISSSFTWLGSSLRLFSFFWDFLRSACFHCHSLDSSTSRHFGLVIDIATCISSLFSNTITKPPKKNFYPFTSLIQRHLSFLSQFRLLHVFGITSRHCRSASSFIRSHASLVLHLALNPLLSSVALFIVVPLQID